MALSNKLHISTRSGASFFLVDQSATVDGVWIHQISEAGNLKYQVQIEGPYRAAIVCDGSGDETTPLQNVLNDANVDEIVFDSGLTVTINGTLTCGNKRLTIKPGARLQGTGTISGASLDFNWYDDAIDSGLTLSGCTLVGGIPVLTADATADARGHRLYYNGTNNEIRAKISSTWQTLSAEIGLSFLVPTGTTGRKLVFEVPFDCVITKWTIIGDVSGSAVIDLWQDVYANGIPTVADTITGANKPTLSSAQTNQNTSISWTLTKGSLLAVNVDSVTTIAEVYLTLTGYRS